MTISSAAAQSLPDATTLNGPYYVRYLGSLTDPADSAVSFSGTMTFDGKGGFTVTGAGASAATKSKALSFLPTGQYQVLSSGMVLLTNPFDATNGTTIATANTIIYGGVGSGIISGSSTDTLYADLFVAIPAGSAGSLASLTGTYRMASLEFLGGDFNQTRDTFSTVTADGKGSLGNVSVVGYSQNAGDAKATQVSTGATYTLAANGTGTLVLPGPNGVTAAQTLISGTKTLYVSADGNFFIAGNPTGFDLIIGAKSSTAAASGLYWNSYLENYAAGTQVDGLYAAQGSANELGGASALELGHLRTNPDGFPNFDDTYSDSFVFGSDGTVTYSDSAWALGAGSNVIIGTGVGSNYQLVIYNKAPLLTGTGVFLHPQGVLNGANNMPITAGIAEGTVVTLYGSGMSAANAAAQSLPFPTGGLGNVQVMVNGTTPMALFDVRPTQISGVVPFSLGSSLFLTFQVINNGTKSNVVSVYKGFSSPGIFTVPPGGIGPGAILHADFSIVNAANPAKVGETVQMFLTGLGAVSPTVIAGTAAPSNPPAKTTNPVEVYLDSADGSVEQQATVVFSGLAPTLGGLYQLNFTIPSGLPTGNASIILVTYFPDQFSSTGFDTDVQNVGTATIAIK